MQHACVLAVYSGAVQTGATRNQFLGLDPILGTLNDHFLRVHEVRYRPSVWRYAYTAYKIVQSAGIMALWV